MVRHLSLSSIVLRLIGYLLGILSSSMLLFSPGVWASSVMTDPLSPLSPVAEWRTGSEVLPGPQSGAIKVLTTTEIPRDPFPLPFSLWVQLGQAD